jgi:alginate O-acetyltransferase complex protein AlgJ
MNSSARPRTLLRFFGRLLVFLLPLLHLPLLEIVALRHGWFTFRVWEMLEIHSVNTLPEAARVMPGPFYPNQRVAMWETGDLGHHSRWAVRTWSTWETDRYGYRSGDFGLPGPEIVLVGDSMAVSSSLDQSSTLGAALARRTGLRVATMARASMLDYLRHERFRVSPPKVVILESTERYVDGIPRCVDQPPVVKMVDQRPWRERLLLTYLVARDEHEKHPARSWFEARKAGPTVPAHVATDDRMLFLSGRSANVRAWPPAGLDNVVAAASSCRDLLAPRGIQFMFLVVPEKETVYFDLVPGGTKPEYASTLIARVRSARVATVDLVRLFADWRAKHQQLLYNLDDTHWNATGVSLAADAIASALGKAPQASRR